MRNVTSIKTLVCGIGLLISSIGGICQTKISGRVIDDRTATALPGASVSISDKLVGTITDEEGNFSFSTNLSLPLSIAVSALGYERVVIPAGTGITIRMTATNSVLQEYVVTASRVEERLLQTPVTVEKADLSTLRATSSVGVYEHVQNLKGVEMITIGITNKQVNARGFTLPGNSRFLQLVDGVDNQAPGISMSVGNLFTASEADIESIEVIPGAASALYGPIAFNGVLLIKTKDPFISQGLSAQIKSGINHVDEAYGSVKPFNEFALRYAKVLGRFAFKVNGAVLRGEEWYAVDYTDVDVATPESSRGINNPARNGLNLYGDEVVRDLPGIGRVSRTPYKDMDLMNNGIYSFKFSTALHYRITNNLEAIYQYNFGQGRAVNTGSARFLLDNFQLQQHRVEVKGKQFLFRSYWSGERSGDTYNLRKLAQDMNLTWVQDLSGLQVAPENATDTWFMRYAEAFNGKVSGLAANSHSTARAFADQGRLMPGQREFEQEKDRLTHTYGAKGAGIFTRSSIFHAESQYDFSSHLPGFQLLAGGNFRRYSMFSKGTLFDDLAGKIHIDEFGAYVQAARSILDQKLRISSSLRLDKNENFDAHLTPRLSAVLQISSGHFLRASFQTGFRNPVPVDQFIKFNNGSLTVLGGVPANSRGMSVFENSFTYGSVLNFNKEVSTYLQQGQSQSQAIANASGYLQHSTADYIKPELARTYEVGYRALIGKYLSLDLNYYHSDYTDFIITARLVRPSSPVVLENGEINLQAANEAYSGNAQSFIVSTNAPDKVFTQGSTLGLNYEHHGYNIFVSEAWNNLDYRNANRSNIPAFNTPEYRTTISLRKKDIIKRFGLSVSWRWQSKFQWYGTFNDMRPGSIPAYHLTDIAIFHELPARNLLFKIGGDNVFNKHVSQAYGSPAIGGIYYVSVCFN